MTGADLAEAARALAGAPFRLHGRDPAQGLDCVGVVVAAFRACGHAGAEPVGYALRNSSVDTLLQFAGRAGLAETCHAIAPGDILLARPGPGQHHLLVALDRDRFVHAHAGLRRVVVQRGPLPWPLARHWRLAEKET